MKACLICYRKENGKTQQDPDCDFICSDCVHKLTYTNRDKIISLYIEAVKKGQDKQAYALHSFVPIKFRQPIKIRRV